MDSPLSVNVTDVFKKHPECFDEETLAILHAPENNDPFGFERLTYVRTLEESKALNDMPGPFIVIAASGMCEAGRVVHHLANSVGDPKNIIMIVGYQAEHTLGKRLVMKEPVVNIFGEPHEVKAEVVVLNSFSAHADRNEIAGLSPPVPAPPAAEGLPGPRRSGPVRETRSDAHRRELRRGPHPFARDPHPARMTQAFARACRSCVPAIVLVLSAATVRAQEITREPEQNGGGPDSTLRVNTASILFDKNLNTFNWLGRLTVDTVAARTRIGDSGFLSFEHHSDGRRAARGGPHVGEHTTEFPVGGGASPCRSDSRAHAVVVARLLR